MTWRLRMLVEDIWLPSVCRLCSRPTGGPALAVRGPEVDKPPVLPEAFRHLQQRLCPGCLAAYAQPAGSPPTPSGLSPSMPPLRGWIGAYGANERRLIHALKYHGRADLAVVLGELLAVALSVPWLPEHVLVPVPLHPERLKSRGYNQAGLIARAAAAKLGWRYRETLRRVRATETQAGRDRAGREQNVAGAFTSRGSMRGERVMIVDDVCTTGATLAAVAEACVEAGAATVSSAVLFVAPASDLV